MIKKHQQKTKINFPKLKHLWKLDFNGNNMVKYKHYIKLKLYTPPKKAFFLAPQGNA